MVRVVVKSGDWWGACQRVREAGREGSAWQLVHVRFVSMKVS